MFSSPRDEPWPLKPFQNSIDPCTSSRSWWCPCSWFSSRRGHSRNVAGIPDAGINAIATMEREMNRKRETRGPSSVIRNQNRMRKDYKPSKQRSCLWICNSRKRRKKTSFVTGPGKAAWVLNIVIFTTSLGFFRDVHSSSSGSVVCSFVLHELFFLLSRVRHILPWFLPRPVIIDLFGRWLNRSKYGKNLESNY